MARISAKEIPVLRDEGYAMCANIMTSGSRPIVQLGGCMQTPLTMICGFQRKCVIRQFSLALQAIINVYCWINRGIRFEVQSATDDPDIAATATNVSLKYAPSSISRSGFGRDQCIDSSSGIAGFQPRPLRAVEHSGQRGIGYR